MEQLVYLVLFEVIPKVKQLGLEDLIFVSMLRQVHLFDLHMMEVWLKFLLKVIFNLQMLEDFVLIRYFFILVYSSHLIDFFQELHH